MSLAILLVVAPNQALRHYLQDVARTLRLQLLESSGKSTLSRFFENSHPHLVVIGPAVEHPWEALQIARLVRQWTVRAPIIVVTTQGSEELAVSSMRAGVSDYFRMPFEITDLGESIRRLLVDSTNASVAAGHADRNDARDSTPLIGTGGEVRLYPRDVRASVVG